MSTAAHGDQATHPTQGIDDLVHQRARLGILAVAHEARRVEFSYLLDTLAFTPGNLSQHLRVLKEAGLVRIDKMIDGRRPRTWVSITRKGRRGLLDEITALKAIIARVEQGGGDDATEAAPNS